MKLSCAALQKLRRKSKAIFESTSMASDVSAFERKPLSSENPGREPDVPFSQADAQLRAEIRLLGRILGDTVRDQDGDDVFDLVEAIRQASIRFHRDEDFGARHELEAMLDGRSIAESVRIVRAYSFFFLFVFFVVVLFFFCLFCFL